VPFPFPGEGDFSAACKAAAERKPLIAALKCVRENVCRPVRDSSASHFTQDLRPGLTYFAPLGLDALQTLFHRFDPKSNSHAHTGALRHPKSSARPLVHCHCRSSLRAPESASRVEGLGRGRGRIDGHAGPPDRRNIRRNGLSTFMFAGGRRRRKSRRGGWWAGTGTVWRGDSLRLRSWQALPACLRRCTGRRGQECPRYTLPLLFQ
jgi:hypothetical protein